MTCLRPTLPTLCLPYQNQFPNSQDQAGWTSSSRQSQTKKVILPPHSRAAADAVHERPLCMSDRRGANDPSPKELEGYQNRECAGYKLTLDNDGAHFCWTPNV